MASARKQSATSVASFGGKQFAARLAVSGAIYAGLFQCFRYWGDFSKNQSAVLALVRIIGVGVGGEVPHGQRRSLFNEGQLTTAIDQVALAFTAPANLPPAGVYQQAIEAERQDLNR